MKIFKEIIKVGLFNWIWFVIYLKRNEFSNKLNIHNFKNPYDCVKARDKAHNIDNLLSQIK